MDLDSIANKIKTFENPNFETEKNTEDIRFRLDTPEEQQVSIASEASDRRYTETDKVPEIDYDMSAGDVAEQVSAKAAIEPLYRLDVFDKDFASEIAIQEAMQRTKMYRENEQWRRATKKLWTGIYDSMSPLASFISMIEERTGRIIDENNPYWLENAAMSKAQERTENLRSEYTNKDTGETISLTAGNSRGGIREILQNDYKDVEHLQSIAAIPHIIENSIFIDEQPNEDLERYPGVKSFSYLLCMRA